MPLPSDPSRLILTDADIARPGPLKDALAQVDPHATTHAPGGSDPLTPASIGAVAATRFRTGTGSPEGVVAAPVGTVYTDTAATNGAIEWTKWSGTGATGWVVTKGDTGWRSLDLLNGWGNNGAGTNTSPAVRRVNNTVMIRMRNLDSRGSTNTVFATLPSGFIPPSADGGIGIFGGSTVRPVYVSTDGTVRVSNPETVGAVAAATSISYITAQAWPTTLPGTPA